MAHCDADDAGAIHPISFGLATDLRALCS